VISIFGDEIGRHVRVPSTEVLALGSLWTERSRSKGAVSAPVGKDCKPTAAMASIVISDEGGIPGRKPVGSYHQCASRRLGGANIYMYSR
jgi:hypothetical protein